MSFSDESICDPRARRTFASTHWSAVLLASGGDCPQSAEALETLCRTYWYPLYSYARQQGYDPHEAADLTQDFFEHLISTNALSAVRREKGKFRSFLLASLKNLMANRWDRANCLKRGGGTTVVSLDEELAEARFRAEVSTAITPEQVFDRNWAEMALERALQQLRAECNGDEKTQRFDELKVFLIADKGALTLTEAANRLNMSLPAVKALVHRMRKRFAELIRRGIAETVSSPEEVEEEIRYLFRAFSS